MSLGFICARQLPPLAKEQIIVAGPAVLLEKELLFRIIIASVVRRLFR